MDVEKFLDKHNVFAVVGVSHNPLKYGYQVYRDLRNAGYKVYAINPKIDSVLGDRCYRSLSKLPEKPDVVDIVVHPNVTEKIVRECKKLGIKKVWMQPGSESKKAIDFCNKNQIEIVYGVCIVVKRKRQTN